jgi:hypothetical protein
MPATNWRRMGTNMVGYRQMWPKFGRGHGGGRGHECDSYGNNGSSKSGLLG